MFILFISASLLFGQADDDFDDFDDEFGTEQVDDSWDPLKIYNVPMTLINDFVYMHIMSPITKGYKYLVTKNIREGVSNVFHNVQFPIRFANNILQLKFKNAAEEGARFVINSTYGLAGFIDIARIDGGIEEHDEDFGQTLGFYGVGDQVHLVLPLFGPSNLRDTLGLIGDNFVDPFYYAQKTRWNIFDDNKAYLFINTYRTGNEYSLHVDKYESIRKDSIDLYKLLKSAYEQRREALIKE